MGDVFARVIALQYLNMDPQSPQDTSVLRVHLRGPHGTEFHHDFQNGPWHVNNPTLQFLANHGYKPSDIDGTYDNVEDDYWHVQVVWTEEYGYQIHQNAMSGAQEALNDAKWFGPSSGNKQSHDASESTESDVSDSD